MNNINVDEYLEDLQKSLESGEEEKRYWQEDMQFLIDEFRKTRKQFKNAVDVVQELTNELDGKNDFLEDFYNSYEFRFNDAQCVLIGEKQFRKAIGVSGDIDIFLVKEIEEEGYKI